MATIEEYKEYKEYIYKQYKSGKWTLLHIYTLIPKSSNDNWNVAVHNAKLWAKEKIIEENKVTLPRQNLKGNRLRKPGPTKDHDIAKAILNVDSRIKTGSRPQDIKRSRPPSYMGRRLH